MIETRNVHEQLIELCRSDLASGRLAAGQQFPSERELAVTHGISRATANKVLAKLVSEGWLEMRKGMGCFVVERSTLHSSLRHIESFTDFVRNQGAVPGTKVLSFSRSAAVPRPVRESLGLSGREGVISLRRLRLADGEAVIYEERFLPASRYPGLKKRDLEGSFYALCRDRYGLQIHREQVELRATLPPPVPELDWSAPCLRLDGIGLDSRGSPLWVDTLFYHGERFRLLHQVEDASAMPSLRFCYTEPQEIYDNTHTE